MLCTIPNMDHRNEGIEEGSNLHLDNMTMQREDHLDTPLILAAGGDGVVDNLEAMGNDTVEEVLVDEYREFDVLCGRGKSHVNHPGNIHYQELVKLNRERYFNASTNQEKRDITMEIVYALSGKGRFLEKEKGGSRWIVLDTERARIKVAQAVQYKHRRAGGNTIKKLRKRKASKEGDFPHDSVTSPLSNQLAALTDSTTSTKSLTEGGLRFAMGLATQKPEGAFDAPSSLGSHLQLLQQQLHPDPLFQAQLQEQQVLQFQQERIRQLQRQHREQQLHYSSSSSDIQQQQQTAYAASAAARAMLDQGSERLNASMQQSNGTSQLQQGRIDSLSQAVHAFSRPEDQAAPLGSISQAFALGSAAPTPSAASIVFQQPQANLAQFDAYPESVAQRFANLERVSDINQQASRRPSLLDPLSLSESEAHRTLDAASYVWAAQQLAHAQQPQMQQLQLQQMQAQQLQLQTPQAQEVQSQQPQAQQVPRQQQNLDASDLEPKHASDVEPKPFPDFPFQR